MNGTPLQFTLREMHEIFSQTKFWIGFVAIVLVLAISGPFYTAINLNFPERLSYWFIISGICFATGIFISLLGGLWLLKHGLSRPVAQSIAGLIAGVPIAGIVWITGVFIFGFDPGKTMRDLLVLTAECSIISSVIALLFSIVKTPDDEDSRGGSNERASATFLKRIPVELGNDLISLNAQDHYLKVTTTKGSEMILMRLTDACEELSEFEGMQVHRSWWVATAHVQALEREAGKGTLSLSDGQKVPVSRGFLKDAQASFA